jgi:ABC-type branched-subunit amino acid transport system substrate-binding protein
MANYRTQTALTLLLALILTGSVAHAEIKGDAIHIGVLTDMNGIFATAMGPGSVEAARMAADEFGGKINGKPIEILQADHQNKPDLAASLARKWFNDGVQTIADGGSSGAVRRAGARAQQWQNFFLISGAGANQLTDDACAPTSVQWTHDAYSTATALVSGIMRSSKEPWFFITGDYAFGHSVEATARARITELGGEAGSVKAQLGTPDYSSFLLQAQSSGAKILALNVAGDNATAIKQAEEFGLAAQGMTIVPMSFQNVDIHAVGLKTTRDNLILTSFFEDASPAARRFSDAFYARRNAMPSQIQAGVYSAVRHYLQAVKDTDSDDGPTVMAKMRATPVSDAYTPNGRIREDQRMVHDLYLMQVKTPQESKGPWDFVKLVATVQPDQAFRPLDRSKCSLVGK